MSIKKPLQPTPLWGERKKAIEKRVLDAISNDVFYKKHFSDKKVIVKTNDENFFYLELIILETFTLKKYFGNIALIDNDYYSFNLITHRELLDLYTFYNDISFEEFSEGILNLRIKISNLFFLENNTLKALNEYIPFNDKLIHSLRTNNIPCYIVESGDIYLSDYDIKISILMSDVAPSTDSGIVSSIEFKSESIIVYYSPGNEEELILKIEDAVKHIALNKIFTTETKKAKWIPEFFWLIYKEDFNRALSDIEKLVTGVNPKDVFYTHSTQKLICRKKIPKDLWIITANDRNKYAYRVMEGTGIDPFLSSDIIKIFFYIKTKYGYFYSKDGKELLYTKNPKDIQQLFKNKAKKKPSAKDKQKILQKSKEVNKNLKYVSRQHHIRNGIHKIFPRRRV